MADHGEFAQTSAAAAAISSSAPPKVSLRKMSAIRAVSGHEPRMNNRAIADASSVVESGAASSGSSGGELTCTSRPAGPRGLEVVRSH